MADITLDEFLRDNHDSILVAVQDRMRGDEDMGRVAEHRELSEVDLTGQVLGFWLEGIRTDIALGSTAAMEQNMQWLLRLREGHTLPFEDATVSRTFDAISAEIEARLDSEADRSQYEEYRQKARALITRAFPV